MDESYVRKIEAENEQLQKSLSEANNKLDRLKNLYNIPEFILSYDPNTSVDKSFEVFKRFKKDLLDYTYERLLEVECWTTDEDEFDVRHISLPLKILFYTYETKLTITIEVPTYEELTFSDQEHYSFSVSLCEGEMFDKFKKQSEKVWSYHRMNSVFLQNAIEYLRKVKEADEDADLSKIKIHHKK